MDILVFFRLQRHVRQIPGRKHDFAEDAPSCNDLGKTATTPFVVILLYRTSGRFLGMGSIIDKQTILTAASVVDGIINKPFKLLVLAGRLNAWWGKDSQVQPASEIIQADPGLALVTLKNRLVFNKNVSPIKLTPFSTKEFQNNYGKDYGVFGIPRTGWDVPGQTLPKSSIYLMKVETAPDALDTCEHTYPDYDFNDTTMTCTWANGTYAWGCLGSPTVGVDKKDELHQIAVVVKTTQSDTENYHFHQKIAPYGNWIRAHSLLK